MVDDVSVRHRLRVDDANGRIVICWYSTWRTSMAKKPIQIDAVSYYSLDDRGFVEAHEVDRVEISPVLIKKGGTLVAIYGLGNMRDERLNRMWNQKKVTFLRPALNDDRDKFFSILVLHQRAVHVLRAALGPCCGRGHGPCRMQLVLRSGQPGGLISQRC